MCYTVTNDYGLHESDPDFAKAHRYLADGCLSIVVSIIRRYSIHLG